MELLIFSEDGISSVFSTDLVHYINSKKEKDAPILAHSDFLKKVPKVLGESTAGNLSCSYKDSSGKKNPCYRLPKREACLMAMSYSYELQAKVFDAWQELEAQQAPVPVAMPTFPELLRQHADVLDKLALAAPKVEFVDNFVTASSGSMGFREVCKLLSVNESTFRKFLDSEKIVYRLNGGKMPYANHLDAGRFEVKAGVNSGTGHAFNTYRFTAKGVEWVAGELAKWQLRGEV